MQTCLIFLSDGQVFVLKLVEVLSGNTYFSMYFDDFFYHWLYFLI